MRAHTRRARPGRRAILAPAPTHAQVRPTTERMTRSKLFLILFLSFGPGCGSTDDRPVVPQGGSGGAATNGGAAGAGGSSGGATNAGTGGGGSSGSAGAA